MSADQSKCVANNPAAIEAATFVHDLVTKKVVNQPGGSYNAQVEMVANRLGMFGAGIWPNATWTIPQSQANQRVRDRALAAEAGRRHSGRRGRLPDLQHHSNKKAAIWEFIKYTISEEFQREPGGDVRR